MTTEYSIQKMVSDGTLSTITLGIQYLQRNDIYMRIAGDETPQSGAPSGYTWSFVDNTTLKILPVVASGTEVVIYRRTDVDAMYNIYSQNAQFDEATIDENNQQLLYIAQEYLEQGLPGAGVDTIEYLRDDGSYTYYRIKRTDGSYSAEFKVPSAGTAAKVLAREALRRTYAEAGLTLVAGSFEAGGTLNSASDVLLHEGSGKAYGWTGPFPKVVAAGSAVTGFVDKSAFSDLRGVNVKSYGAIGDGLTDCTGAFALAAVAQAPIYVPTGEYKVTTIPSGLLYGQGVISVSGVNFYLDNAIPTRINIGTPIDPSDPNTHTADGRFFNVFIGPTTGAVALSADARASTVIGSNALQKATAPARATGVGKEVFKNATDVYSCDAFGSDALGQGDAFERCSALGANTLKWAGSKVPVETLHDYYRNTGTGNGDFITAIYLDAPTRWPTIRNDFIGSITTPNASRIPQSRAEVGQSIGIGRNALLHALKSDSNVAVGVNSLAHLLDASYNTAIGTRALRDCVSGNHNVGIGNSAASLNISGSCNVALGSSALGNNSHAWHNVAIGYEAALGLTGTEVSPSETSSARRNVFIGSQSGKFATNGIFNTAIGSGSLQNTNGSNNTAVGAGAMTANTTGAANTSVGFGSLGLNTAGSNNTAVGVYSMRLGVTNAESVALGYQSLNNSVGTSGNTAVGFNALVNANSAAGTGFNTAVGHNALRYSQSGGSHVGFVNCAGIGSNARVSGDNQVQLGDTATSTYVYGTVQNRSDLRDKTNIQDTELGIDFIMGLRPVDGCWDMRDDYQEEYQEQVGEDENGDPVYETKIRQLEKDGSKARTRKHHWFIAQEVKELCDKLGVEFGGYQDHAVNGGDDVLTLGYDEFIPPTVKAVQQCWARLDEIDARLKALEAK